MRSSRVKWVSDDHGWFVHGLYIIDLYNWGSSWAWELSDSEDGNYCGEGQGYDSWQDAALDAIRYSSLCPCMGSQNE